VSVNVTAALHPASGKLTAFEVDPGTIAEIITKLDSGFPARHARVCRNGEIVTDFSIRAQDGDVLSIKFVPYGGGSPEAAGRNMKLGGTALMFLGFVITAAAGWTGIGAAIGVSMIGTGVGLLAGGGALMNINIPSMQDRKKPEQDPSIRGGKNQARPGGRIPVLFGRHRIYPDLAANPHTEVIGDAQYFTQLFCGGYRDCVIDLGSFKLGDTPLADLSGTGDIGQILSGADPLVRLEILQNGEASTLYPNCVHEDMINAELKHEVEDGEGKKISGAVIRTTPDNTDAINVDIFFYNGLGKYDGEGRLASHTVKVEASYRKVDGNWESLGFFTGATNAISGAELKTKRYQVAKKDLPRGKYEVKVERITEDFSDGKYVDQVYVGSIRSIKSKDEDGIPVRPIRAERQGGLTVIALRLMATSKVSGVVDSFNYIATSKLPVYSGTGTGETYWLASAETRNPAAMLLCALRGRAAQQRVDPADIDWPSVEAFFRWCEEHNYYCDAYLSESVTVAELLRMIGSTARAEILRIDSKIAVVQDIERPSPLQLFTPKNTKAYSLTMFSADVPDAISLGFIAEESGYAQNEAKVYNTPDGGKIKEPDTVQKIDLWGVTGQEQARRIGLYNYGCLNNRPFVHTIEVDIEYLLCNKGDWIQYAGDIALTGSAQGRIAEMLFSEDIGRYVGIRADEPLETEPGKNYAVRVRLNDGTVLLKDVSVIRSPDEMYFTEPFEKNYAPNKGDVYAFGIRGQEVIDLIITDIQPGSDLSATLACVEYSPEIFGVDDPDFKLPPFENKVTPVSGAIDSGVVGPARWRLFVTYHDAEDEPPRPRGDGQENGWHYAHTVQALWQSSKTAESVEAGEWGAPVRIKGERSADDAVAVWLALSPQSKIIETDSGGNFIAGSLPFTARAELFKWNWKIPVAAGIMRYPGSGANLFDPMLGDFVPAVNDVAFSLVNAPQGVTVDGEGVVAVAANAVLKDDNLITVRAAYQGEVYAQELRIQINRKWNGEALYLGTIDTLPQGPEVVILKGQFAGRRAALQFNYVLAVKSGTGWKDWKQGYVYQWTGATWEERSPADYSELYVRCFKDGLDAPGLATDMGWFGALFVQRLMAVAAFIETLEAMHIILKDTGALQSEKFKHFLDGFLLTGTDGEVEINNVLRLTSSGDRPLAIGTIRTYIDKSVMQIQRYEGNGMWKTLVALSLIAGLGTLSCQNSVTSDAISSSSPFGTSSINCIAYGNNKFVAVSSSGKIAYSTDGINWTAVSNSTFGESIIETIAYGNGKFVAGSATGGKMAYSTDGINWTAVSNSTFGESIIETIAYGNDKFIAVGQHGKMAYSTDGINWTAVSNLPFGTDFIRTVAYGNNKFVAGGINGKMAYSTDGINWTAVSNSTFGTNSLANTIYTISYGNNKFVAGGIGKMAYSTDGINWTAVSNSTFGESTIEAIAYYCPA
jgi:hypothetical protein